MSIKPNYPLRIAVAKALWPTWEYFQMFCIESKELKPAWAEFTTDGGDEGEFIPAFEIDLAAAFTLGEEAKRLGIGCAYIKELLEIPRKMIGVSPYEFEYAVAHASAPVRCAAFLRAMGHEVPEESQ